MNKTFLAAGIGALLLSGVVGARSDLARPDTTRSDTTRSDLASSDAVRAQPDAPRAPVAPAPIVLAQAAEAASPQPAPQLAPPPPDTQDVYMQDPAAVGRIDAQIDSMLQQPRGGFAVTYYAKPAPPPEPAGPGGRLSQEQLALLQQQSLQQQQQQRQLQPGEVLRDRSGNPERYVIARAGDTVYATLDRAFNSDDPQAPMFASIRDVDSSGIQGPLDGVRMIGKLKYSSSEGTIQFEKGYLPDGRPIMIKGVAISEDNARSGFAKDVDTHDFQRYSSLLLATLVQGAGQVGQTLVQGNQQAYVDPNTGLLVGQQRVSPYQAALGALLPAGQALTAVAAQNFNKPATISAPAGFGLGIVFLEPVVVPRDVLFARNR